MELFFDNNNKVCPRCDGNGYLYQAILMPINKKVVICDECEALWTDPQNIHIHNVQDFTVYITSMGSTYDQISVMDIDYDWHRPQ